MQEPLPNPTWVRQKGNGAVVWASHCTNLHYIGNTLETPGPSTNLKAPFQAEESTCRNVITDEPRTPEGMCFTE